MTDAVASVLDDPFVRLGLFAVIGSLMSRIVLRGHRTFQFFGQVAFFAVLTILLLYGGIVPFKPGPTGLTLVQEISVGLSKIVWWTNAAWSLISFVRAFLIWEGSPREGRLLQDLVVALIYIGALLSVVAYVFDAPIGTLIATSGIFAIVLGLAMQSTLSDVFSGIALNLSRPYAIGDWIVLKDQIEGRVAETNWRATHLINGVNDLVVIPNSDLAKARIVNLNSPERSHGMRLTVHIAATRPPAFVIDVMNKVLASSNSILFEPPPLVQVKALSASAIEVDLVFRVSDTSKSVGAQNEIFDLVFRHARAAGLKLAAANNVALLSREEGGDQTVPAKRSTPLQLLSELPFLSGLTDAERETLADRMTRRTYRKGDVVAPQGEVSSALGIVRSGIVVAQLREGDRDVELDRLAPGDCFGAKGLLEGKGETLTFSAATFAVVYRIARSDLEPLLADRPTIVDGLAATEERRNAALQRLAADPAPARSPEKPLVDRIRQFFQSAG